MYALVSEKKNIQTYKQQCAANVVSNVHSNEDKTKQLSSNFPLEEHNPTAKSHSIASSMQPSIDNCLGHPDNSSGIFCV